MNELENRIEKFATEFNGKNIEMEFGNYINGKIYFDNIDIKYDKSNGILRFLKDNNFLEFDISDINKFDYFDNKIKIKFDNYLDLIIVENRWC